MFDKDVLYKFELDNNIFYTGNVIDENDDFIKIFTFKKEEITINKKHLRQSKTVFGDRNGTI